MGLDLTPRNYLEMLTDEYREYRDNRLSMRKAINCCGLSNALPEVITAHHNPFYRRLRCVIAFSTKANDFPHVNFWRDKIPRTPELDSVPRLGCVSSRALVRQIRRH